MLYKNWITYYKKIAQDLDLPFKQEKIAAEKFNNILREKKLNLVHEKKLKYLLKDKEIVVFGSGPSLEKTIIEYNGFIKEKIKISADGATTALLENNIHPDITVTDLDGKISDLVKANQTGCVTLIHAHGDNRNKIIDSTLKFKGEIMGTIQIDPSKYKNLHNYGGFTDGDRAIFLSEHFNAKKIYLTGFDFTSSSNHRFNKSTSISLRLLTSSGIS